MFATVFARVFGALDRIVEIVGGTALLTVTAVVFLNAMGRYLFGFALLGAEEFARLLTVHLCFLGAYLLLRRDGHVSVDVLLVLLPAPVLRVLRGVTGLLAAGIMAYLAVLSWQLVGFSAATGQKSTTLPVPRYLFFLPIAVGASLMTLAGLEKAVRAVMGTLPPLALPGLEPPGGEGAEGAGSGAKAR